ncbi:amino acid adenylation domain-containing protein [Burkholderia sp. 22PA0099]|uniref:amino acid adenylation domain-containing protein n=1 Tax=Burkholderia sp. 22PA0099 TaxID=3237372 RepID=UPI0039C1C662
MEELSLDALKEELLRLLAEEESGLPAASDEAPVPVARDAALPLSFAQQRMWFLDRLDRRASAAYHVPAGVRLRGALNVAALRRALDRIVERHEVLRTRFATTDGEPVLQIDARRPFALEQHDLSGLADAQAALLRHAEAEADAPFDLSAGPVVRGRLLRMGEQDHVLLVTMHHIVSDGWSMGVLIREFGALYQAFVAGQPDPLPPLAIQYADYAVWQRRRVSGEMLQQQLAYWKRTLRDAPALTTLPLDHARPAVQDHAGDSVDVMLDAPLVSRIKTLARQQGTTVFNVMLAAWAALAARLSGQDEVVIGTPVANRMNTEVEPLIGFFVNTLALRIDLTGQPSVGEAVRRVHEAALAAQAHQDLPFEQVIEAVNPARSRSHAPLFQLMMVWQNYERANFELSGLQLESMAAAQIMARFDLSLIMREHDGRIGLSMLFATSLFERASIERYLGYFEALLGAMVDDAGAPVQRIGLLAEAERRQVMEGGNDTAMAYTASLGVHGAFEAQAARTPDAVAVRFGDQALTYAQLDARANRLAHRLVELGVGREVVVGVCLHRGIDLLAALLAVMKAGGAYLPLDPAFPAERLAMMLGDAQPALVLTHDGLLADHDKRLDLGEWPAGPEQFDSARLDRSGGELAYVLYTSGSTGRPKGVQVTQQNVMNLLASMQRDLSLQAHDRLLSVTTLSFDIAALELYLPLISGACVVIASRETAQESSRLAREIESQQITAMQATPSTWRMLADHGWQPKPGFMVLSGGEALPRDLAESLLRAVPSLVNLYGPTETTIWSTFSRLAHSEEGTRIDIGRPIANTQVHVLDDALELVPVGVAGELFIAGDGVARGYRGRPDLTAERFVPNPYGVPGSRMYRTGDRVRRLATGELEYLGRIDQQVKLRGFRIELGEIEATLRGLPEVRDAAVAIREDQPGQQRLVAYAVAAHGHEPTNTPELRQALSRTLPDYMIPSQLIWLDALPLTPNGKLDRRALPTPDAPQSGADYVAPRTETEQALSAIWQETLKLDRVGIHDNFFDLGGHSLLAMQLASRIRARLGADIALADLFEAPTVAALAARLSGAGAEPEARIEPVPRDALASGMPLSPGQERLWFLNQLEPASPAYNLPHALLLRGALDIAAVQSAFDAIVQRHEILRTRIVGTHGRPQQAIAEAQAVDLPLHDLTPLPAAQRKPRADALVAELAAAPFDLATDLPLRAHLIRLADDAHVLLVTMHHVVSDGWSIGVMMQEFAALYTAFAQRQPSPLPPVRLQYLDFAVWQIRLFEGPAIADQLAYWTRQLDGAPTLLTLPTDRARPAVRRSAGGNVAFVVPAATAASLRELAGRHRASLFMALAAAYGVLLARYAGQRDVCIGTPVAGRQRTELESMLGMFMNMLVLRCEVDGALPFDAFLERMRAVALGAYANQDLPFERLVDALKLERHLSHTPLFQAFLQVDNAALTQAAPLPGIEVERWPLDGDTAKYDLSLLVSDVGSELHCRFQYAADLFDAATVERMARHFGVLLTSIVGNPSGCVGDLALVDEAEREHMLRDWNDSRLAVPDMGLHTRFEQHAEARPQQTAVVVGDASLTYHAANARANQLAHWLRGRGVGPEVKVAVCLERSVDLIVALIAVLKAGGVYVPLDASFPAERLAYMAKDSGALLILTQASLRAALQAVPVEQLALDDGWAPVAAMPRGNPANLTGGENLAYVIYTSGSTGMPKGVQITHRGIVNYLHWGIEGYPMRDGERASFTHLPLIFDASLTTLFIPLWAGRDIHLPLPGGHDRIVDSMREAQQLSMVKITPAHIDLMAAALQPEDVRTRVRTSVIGGDVLTIAQFNTWLRYFPGTVVVNEYGPTETVVGCCVEYVDPAALSGASVLIGKPIANMQHYILDARGHPVPPGVIGELYIAGAGVARGYLGRPKLTAEKFVPDPFGPPGSRMYRTGDLSRYLPDGRIDFLGRMDNQVKIRGFRVELGEIEAALVMLPAIREAVVLALDNAAGQKALAAYLVMDGEAGGEADLQTCRAALRQTLPDYMVPTEWIVLDALPLTTSGKVDRKALPAPAYDAREGDYVAPETDTEIRLAEVCATVLGVARVGRLDSIFEFGANSLLVVQLAAQVTREFGIKVPLAMIFEVQTVAGMARYVDGLLVELAHRTDDTEQDASGPTDDEPEMRI